MDIEKFTQVLNPELIERFRRAIESGKWPDGRALTKEQRSICLQAVIAYEHKHVQETERTGYVPPKKTACAPKDDVEEIKWKP